MRIRTRRRSSFARAAFVIAIIVALASGCAGILGVEGISIDADASTTAFDAAPGPAAPCTDSPGCADATTNGAFPDAAVDPTKRPEPPVINPQLWLDARLVDAGTTSAVWVDQSASHVDAIGSLPINVVGGAIQGRPAMRFPGAVGQTMRVAETKLPFSLADGITLFVVAQAAPTPEPSFCSILMRSTSPNRNGVWLFWQVPRDPLVTAAVLSYASPLPNDVGMTFTSVKIYVPHVYALRILGGKARLSQDGVVESEKTLAQDNPDFQLVNTVPLSIAGPSTDGVAGELFSGDIGEVLVYTRGLDDVAFSSAIQRLRTDWGLNN